MFPLIIIPIAMPQKPRLAVEEAYYMLHIKKHVKQDTDLFSYTSPASLHFWTHATLTGLSLYSLHS